MASIESPIEALCSIFIAVLDDRPVILAQVEAIVRVMGCACDNDWSMGISWEEANAGECVMVQTALFGQNVTEEMFNAADANGDGEIDGTEAATVIEEMMGQQAAGRSGLRKRSRKLRRRKLSKKSCKNCRN